MEKGILKRALGHRTIFAGCFILLLFIFLSVFSSVIVMDNTKDSNRQIPQIPLLQAGALVNILIIDKPNEPQQWIPVKACYKKEGALMCDVIQNSDMFSVEKTFALSTKASYEVRNVRFLLGTDVLGRDILSRLIKGIKISLFVGFLAMIISLVVGIFVGLIAGYYEGWVDDVLMLIINSVWSIPTLLLVFSLVMVFGRGMTNIYLAVGLTMWVEIARMTRGMVKQIKQRGYVRASKALSLGKARIFVKHILPNTLDPITVLAASNFATAVLVEAGLSYLGFGVEPPKPSVGIILSENYGYILSGHVWKAVMPAITILLIVLSLNLIGNGLRDLLDVKTTTEN